MTRKVTKEEVKGTISCIRQEEYENLIDLHWIRSRKKLSITEVVEKARNLDVSEIDIAWMLSRLDFGGWFGIYQKDISLGTCINRYLIQAKRKWWQKILHMRENNAYS